VPVAGMSVSKRPKNRRACQTGNDIWVFINVGIVVVIDEIMPQRLPEDGPGDARQGDADCHDPQGGEAFSSHNQSALMKSWEIIIDKLKRREAGCLSSANQSTPRKAKL